MDGRDVERLAFLEEVRAFLMQTGCRRYIEEVERRIAERLERENRLRG